MFQKANAGTIDLLEVETSERMRLERDLDELRVRRIRLVNIILKTTKEFYSKNLCKNDDSQIVASLIFFLDRLFSRVRIKSIAFLEIFTI